MAKDKAPLPSIFIAHGSPVLLDDTDWVHEINLWADHIQRPKSILLVSAHWETKPTTLGATRPTPLLYDFFGFPQKYYEVTYAQPGAPELASRVRTLLAPHGGTADDPQRGLDHGAYVPLVAMYPRADIPVLQISMPSLDPTELLALGKALAPLRHEGVLIIGSGFMVHNMSALDMSPKARPATWAREFDAWVADALVRRDTEALLDYQKLAPGVKESLPTHEHFAPLFVAYGAALDEKTVTFPIDGFAYGSMTRRSAQFGG